ncbi:MAG: protease modulator HflC [Spirochaetales bacterium]|nr:protease modulator HflC [Spirochaetales bacterium]
MKQKDKNNLVVLLVVLGLVALIIFLGPFYIVREGTQAVVVRFGEVIDVTTEPGLHFKIPVIDEVVMYSARVLSWDGEAQRIPTSEQQFIWVDTTARWRISDPKVFYANITSMGRAYSRLDGIIDSVVRTVVSANSITEAVRDTNHINTVIPTETVNVDEAEVDEEMVLELVQNPNLVETREVQPRVNKGRTGLMTEMLTNARQNVTGFGIEIIDVVVRQIRYTDDLTSAVFQRMISDRNRIAQFYRSYGEGRKNTLLGELENQKVTVLSDARRRAEEIKGTADAQAAAIYAEAYGTNPEFFAFWRSLESYRDTLPNLPKTMSTDMDYFRYLYSQRGQ